jgi:hypothetical protein
MLSLQRNQAGLFTPLVYSLSVFPFRSQSHFISKFFQQPCADSGFFDFDD